ncbi:MAG: PBP1A family penicillin-binding protein [Acidisphaera sp.]|nr:PBP1A family penicillin-binding protein [Acidisphaera sp.]
MSSHLTAGERLLPPDPSEPRPPRSRAARTVRRRPTRSRFMRRVAGAVAGLFLLACIGGGAAVYVGYLRYAADLPGVDGLRHYQPRVMSRVYAGDGQLLEELATERRIFVPYTAIPDIVRRAFVSAEDQNFWVHRGVDPLAIARAAITDVSLIAQGKRPIGASTITQQVAKNMLLGNEVTLARKIKEALLALRIERTLSKERILELYLNEIYLGQQSYGIAAAAQAYFNKSLDQLSVADAAFLAALPKAPNNYNPFRFADAARGRRDWVLDRMAEDRAITRDQAQAAKAEPVVPAAAPRPEMVQGASYFAEDVRRTLVDRFGADAATQGGLMVRTTLDPALQTAADRSLRDGLMAYDRQHGGWRGPVGHLDASAAALRTAWTGLLAPIARPTGMLPGWQLAVVLDETAGEARLGWLDRPVGAAPGQAPTPHTGSLPFADIGWARANHDGRFGAVPHRISDVLQVGDVVMVEPSAGSAAAPPLPGQRAAPAAPGERLALRQVPQVEGALVSLDPRTGRVLALAGGWSYEMSQFDRASQASRQPGSSFKPIVYLTAMEQGISPSQRFLDAPFVLDLGAAGQWRPNDYEMDFLGPVSLHVALEKSLNLVTVRLAQKIGMEAVAQNAIAFHVVDNMPRVLPAALGAVDTTVLRMAGAYASLDEGGREVVPTMIDSVQDRDGHVIWRQAGLACESCADPAQRPVLDDQRKEIADAASAFQVVTMMQGVVQRGTGVPAGKDLNRPIAGKTGTTQDFNDAWFGGFTPDLVTVVWVGFDTPASLGNNETGGAVAAPIWHDFMAVALKNRPVLAFTPPAGVTMAAWNDGYGMVTDAFKPGQEPGASALSASVADSGAGAAATGSTAAASSGLDTGMGGLY